MRYLLLLSYLFSAQVFAVGFANGLKIGEVRAASAVVWTRLTQEVKQEKWDQLSGGAVPGAAGFITMVLWKESVSDKPHSKYLGYVSGEDDFTFQCRFDNLEPYTKYIIELEGRKDLSDTPFILRGEFYTAPAATQDKAVAFTVSAYQSFLAGNELEYGHQIYPSMSELNANFFVQAGGAVCFDRPTVSHDIAAARFKWNRIYALPYFRAFHQKMPSYWLSDDCWPEQKNKGFTWKQGREVWREQLPMSHKPYRTFRWGKHVQIWLVEGPAVCRDNKSAEGSQVDMLDEEQWQWLRETMSESDATYRIYISPTSVIEMSQKKKNCSQSLPQAGDKLRQFLASQPGCFVISGNRHGQYYASDSKTGLEEFGCGPAVDGRVKSVDQKDKASWQTYFRSEGGFLSVTIGSGEDSEAKLQYHNVQGKVVHTIIFKR